jgi:hypothetical protein
MATFNVPLPDIAEQSESGHIDDHNLIVDSINEVRTVINNLDFGSGSMSPTDILAGTNISTQVNGDTVTVSAPNALIAANILAGSYISVSPSGNNVTISSNDTRKLETTDLIAGSGVTITGPTGASGRQMTISSTGGGGGGVTDHGALTGLADEDHSQYHNDTRGDARYSQLSHNHSGVYATASHTHTDPIPAAPAVLSVLQSGGSYPSRPGGATQTHMYIGTLDPTNYGFVVGYDIWVDTSNG